VVKAVNVGGKGPRDHHHRCLCAVGEREGCTDTLAVLLDKSSTSYQTTAHIHEERGRATYEGHPCSCLIPPCEYCRGFQHEDTFVRIQTWGCSNSWSSRDFPGAATRPLRRRGNTPQASAGSCQHRGAEQPLQIVFIRQPRATDDTYPSPSRARGESTIASTAAKRPQRPRC